MAGAWETTKVDGSDMRMYVSIPEGAGPFPAVLVSQHGPGVNEFIQDVVNNLAKEGYVGCAPTCTIGSRKRCGRRLRPRRAHDRHRLRQRPERHGGLFEKPPVRRWREIGNHPDSAKADGRHGLAQPLIPTSSGGPVLRRKHHGCQGRRGQESL